MSARVQIPVSGYLELGVGPEVWDGPGEPRTLPAEGEVRGPHPRRPLDVAAIYVHFPFCRHICTYCDFDTFSGRERLIEPYLEAVLQQIRRSPEAQAVSLYVGGGTPSLMNPDQAFALVNACRERFRLPEDAEVTIEANPSGLGSAGLEGFREAGFNRLSLGVQSSDDRLLRLLGRRHRSQDSKAAVESARIAGFHNLSVDLIYGVPLQDRETWRLTLEAVVEWGVQHVSCYMLSLEPGTPLERGVARGTLLMPPEDEVVAMYATARDLLGGAGYGRYEISNWSRPGFQSVHNLAYWRNQPYLAIGAGAAGYWQGRRYKILPDVDAFVEGVRLGRVPLVEDESIDPRRSMSDSLILGLRLEEGVSIGEFRERHGVVPRDVFGQALEWAREWGLLECTDERLKLTEQGRMLSNELFARLL